MHAYIHTYNKASCMKVKRILKKKRKKRYHVSLHVSSSSSPSSLATTYKFLDSRCKVRYKMKTPKIVLRKRSHEYLTDCICFLQNCGYFDVCGGTRGSIRLSCYCRPQVEGLNKSMIKQCRKLVTIILIT